MLICCSFLERRVLNPKWTQAKTSLFLFRPCHPSCGAWEMLLYVIYVVPLCHIENLILHHSNHCIMDSCSKALFIAWHHANGWNIYFSVRKRTIKVVWRFSLIFLLEKYSRNNHVWPQLFQANLSFMPCGDRCREEDDEYLSLLWCCVAWFTHTFASDTSITEEKENQTSILINLTRSVVEYSNSFSFSRPVLLKHVLSRFSFLPACCCCMRVEIVIIMES